MQLFIGWLVDDHLLLRDFGPYGIILMVPVVINIATVIVLRDTGPYGIIL
jgi:hypothetical protein